MLLSGLPHDPSPSDRFYLLSLLIPSAKSLQQLRLILEIDENETNVSKEAFLTKLQKLMRMDKEAVLYLRRHIQLGKQRGMFL